MELSAPIYALKRRAKLRARQTGIPLHQALDRVASEEGFRSWSHLAGSSTLASPAQEVLAQLEPGDLILIGARPGHGKTLLGLGLAALAPKLGRTGYFFTLDYHARDVADRLAAIGVDPRAPTEVVIDTSDDVSAGYILSRLEAESAPALIVVDYLQLLDQKRTNPTLDDQIGALRRYVSETGAICAVISQIDRSFDLAGRPMPGIPDVRLPNPLDLSAFGKFFFLHDGKIRIDRAA